MNSRFCLLLTVFAQISSTLCAMDTKMETDSVRSIDIGHVVVFATPKEHVKLRESANSVSSLSSTDLRNLRIDGSKDLSSYVPNFFMPKYGSRLTSSIYIRGIGSRLNSPAVGLYIDNMPYIEKNTYDITLLDIDRVDVLRGPQGTLYGRNTMGGMLDIHTRNPLNYQGTDVRIGAATGNAERIVSFTTNQRVNDKLGYSIGGFYKGNNGFFRNDYTKEKMDSGNEGGGRMRIVYAPRKELTFDWITNYTYSDEKAYPYEYRGTIDASRNPETAETESLIGKITANRPSSYYRSLLNTGLNITRTWSKMTLNSITSYQNLKDHMRLDQDFIKLDIFTLDQKQLANTVSQEITLKSKPESRWQWVTGLFGLYQNMQVDAPVNFHNDGMAMLGQNINKGFDAANTAIAASGMSMAASLTSREMLVNGDFSTPIYNGAIFHQSTYRNLFNIDRLSFTVGLRLDYERTVLDYNSLSAFDYNFSMTRKLPNGVTIPLLSLPLTTSADYVGKLNNTYVQLLPKFALKYDLLNNGGNVYALVSKGVRSGGYNVQMFSDLLQTSLRNNMVKDVMTATNRDGMINVGTNPTADETVVYKPEYSWNYEVGAHLNLFERLLQVDISSFYITTRDQQISRYAESGLGRQMINAGRSRSYGAELSARTNLLNNRLELGVNYGYTHATFTDYNDGEYDYTGNYVPFAPQHTMGALANYRLPLTTKCIKGLTFGLTGNGAGRIYWTEKNDQYQNFYADLGAHILVDFGKLSIDFWGRNLTQNRYDTFYFESMQRGFAQRNNPRQFGFDLRLHL